MDQNTNKKGFAIMSAILILAGILVIVGGVTYFANKEKKIQQPVVVDETANWQVYKNSNYGYEFKYPNGLEINYSSKGDMIAVMGKDGGWIYQIDISPNTNNLSVENYVNELLGKNNYEVRDIMVGGTAAKTLLAKNLNEYGNIRAVLIYKGNIIEIFGDSSNKFEVFLNNFEFTK